jgi:thiazolylpeptide-type bacteriocin precursor
MNAEIKDAPAGETRIDPKFDLSQENFEIEDISDLNLHAPMSITLCSGCASCSACCSS